MKSLSVVRNEERTISSLENNTDESLMIMYQQGESAAFSELYSRHAGKVFAYLKSHLAKGNAAEDLHQIVFLKLHENRGRYNATYPFLPWLFSITRHAMIDSIRKKTAIPVEDSALERLAGSESAPETDSREIELQGAVASLPRAQRELIEMRFKAGLSFEEISDRLRLNEPAIRKRISRAVQSLRNYFGGRENE